ncbi:MAG: hypothetical protein GY765_32385, partial [bacterium]|nr:hypothetical protein [bacterium]
FFTFMNSSAALSPYFYEMARAGFRFDPDLGFPAALPIIRTIGLEMEENMFSETGGVNTQKGIIFLAGLCLFSAAFVINIHGFLDPGAFIAIIREITKGITQDELAKPSEANSDTPLTHGETCFQRFGEQLGAGIRWEVEHGLPTVLKTALPTLLTEIDHSGAFIKEDHLKQALTTTLLAIMSVNNDTNILFRRGPGQLEQVKKTARETLQETDPGKKEILYRQLSDYCLAENISPGGSVDLLAITLFIFFARKEFTKK